MEKQHERSDGQRHHQVWDPGGLQQIEDHDKEAMEILYPGSLMQEHHGQASRRPSLCKRTSSSCECSPTTSGQLSQTSGS